MNLSKENREQLHTALLDAFLSYTDLEIMVSFGLDHNLNQISAETNSVSTTVFRLVKWAEARDAVDRLVLSARKINPTNVKLRTFAERIDLASRVPQEGYERIVMKHVGFQNPEKFRETMSSAELAVGRVEVPGPRGIGTACLVGTSLALTNQHVREEWQRRGFNDTQVAVRFGYWKKEGVEVEKGRVYALAENAIVDYSPVDQLDYVLFRLLGTPGADRLDDAPASRQRGFLKPVKHSWGVREPFLILQHPDERPLELAIGSVLGDAETDRVVHNANTEGGSSGSPCFSANWQLGAIHHWGSDSANKAVKMSAILKNLEAKSLSAQLGL
jgi:V8-like Glu-specific endopeptidase